MYWHAVLPFPSAWCGLYCVLLSISFFSTLDYLLKGIRPPTAVESKGPLAVWKWRNMLISWLHALIIGTWDILCFYYYPELMDDPIGHIVPFTYYMVAVSTGYFFYDFWDMLVQKQIFSMWELTLHHIAVLGAFTYNVINVRYIAYNVIALLAEVNSIFLHTRKLMQMYKIHPMNIIRRLNSLINLITFICCRGFALFCISYGIYMNPDKISSFYSFLLMSSMFIMNILNPILFYILLRNDFLLTHKEINDYYSINDRKKLIDTTYTLDNKKSNYKLTYELNSFTVNRFHQSNSSKL